MVEHLSGMGKAPGSIYNITTSKERIRVHKLKIHALSLRSVMTQPNEKD